MRRILIFFSIFCSGIESVPLNNITFFVDIFAQLDSLIVVVIVFDAPARKMSQVSERLVQEVVDDFYVLCFWDFMAIFTASSLLGWLLIPGYKNPNYSPLTYFPCKSLFPAIKQSDFAISSVILCSLMIYFAN